MLVWLWCLLAFCFLLLLVVILWYVRYYTFYRYMKHIPELKPLPLLGCVLHFSSSTIIYAKLKELRNKLGTVYWGIFWIEPVLMLTDPKLVETILSSTKYIDKSRTYDFFHNWLGLGLLTSTGEKWKKRRKMLTPAFHFKILEEFIEAFGNASDILVEKLTRELTNDSTDIYPYISLCSLDAICESAMGISVNAQTHDTSNYVQSINEITKIIIERPINPLENFQWTYYFTQNYWKERRLLKYLHNFTNSVITRKRAALKMNGPTHSAGHKRRLAFLDLLLNYEVNGEQLSDRDIREEVDTFMFEGHDTTSAAISFALYLLANNLKEQEKAFLEIRNILGNDKNRKASFNDLHQMKYMEMVIKETLRLYPSVPYFSRVLKEDVHYDGVNLPKGLTTIIVPCVMHRDPLLFPDPDAFKPDRFDAFRSSDRSVFEYIPFSAGPRNCIGQKFAMLAMKSTISKILQNYELEPVEHEIILATEAILRSKNGIRLKLKERQW